ncbi:MAG: 30S ribosomal protein S15 [archaeon]
MPRKISRKAAESKDKGKINPTLKLEEFEKIVVDLAKKGTSPEKIGLILRDKYNIPKAKKTYNIKINKILKKHGIEINPNLENLEKKRDRLKVHLNKHTHDYTAKRIFSIRAARVRKATLLAKKEVD